MGQLLLAGPQQQRIQRFAELCGLFCGIKLIYLTYLLKIRITFKIFAFFFFPFLYSVSQNNEFIFVVLQEKTCLMFCTKKFSPNPFLEGEAEFCLPMKHFKCSLMIFIWCVLF